MFGIVERLVDSGLCAVHKAMEAIGRLLPVVGTNDTVITFINGSGNKVNIAIKKIYSPALNSQPGPTVDPGSPSSEVGYYRIWSIVEGRGNTANAFNI